jgi:hypothetical protein
MATRLSHRIAAVLVLALVALLALGVAPAFAASSAGAEGFNAPPTIDVDLSGLDLPDSLDSVLAAPDLASIADLLPWIPGVAITDPRLVTFPSIYDFSADDEYSAPTWFPDGSVMCPGGEIRVVGSSWTSWNPQTDGKHVYFAGAGIAFVLFDSLQGAVGVVAEPNAWGYHDVVLLAINSGGSLSGAAIRSIDGNGGAAFLGVASLYNDIRGFIVISEEDAYGFAFSDLTYGGYATELSVPWMRPLNGGVFSAADSGPASAAMVLDYNRLRPAMLNNTKFLSQVRQRTGVRFGMTNVSNLKNAILSYRLGVTMIDRASEGLTSATADGSPSPYPKTSEQVALMRRAIAAGHPVIAFLGGPASSRTSSDHWAVVTGFSGFTKGSGLTSLGETEIDYEMQVFLNDPTKGIISVPLDEFENALQNVQDKTQPYGMIVHEAGYTDLSDLI